MAKEILSKNIKKLLERKGKTQTDMAKELNLKESTVSSWVNAAKYPRRDKIELMADYFNVSPSDITDEKSKQDTIAAHLDGELSQDDLEQVVNLIEYLKKKNKG